MKRPIEVAIFTSVDRRFAVYILLGGWLFSAVAVVLLPTSTKISEQYTGLKEHNAKDNSLIAESNSASSSEEALFIPGMDGKLRRKKYVDEINGRLCIPKEFDTKFKFVKFYSDVETSMCDLGYSKDFGCFEENQFDKMSKSGSLVTKDYLVSTFYLKCPMSAKKEINKIIIKFGPKFFNGYLNDLLHQERRVTKLWKLFKTLLLAHGWC